MNAIYLAFASPSDWKILELEDQVAQALSDKGKYKVVLLVNIKGWEDEEDIKQRIKDLENIFNLGFIAKEGE